MYAIRSYYGERAARRRPADCRGQEPDHRVPGRRPVPAARHPHAAHRITSYNVCYTKLLRYNVTILLSIVLTVLN